MNIITIILLAILAVALLPLAIVAGKAAGRRLAANSLDHPEGKISLAPSAAITTRYLIGKRGASAGLVAVAATTNLPLCIIEDTATADDVSAGNPITCRLLGASQGTVRMVAAGVIPIDVDVYSVGSGKVDVLADAATGDYRVGRSVTAAAADGDVILVVPELPTYTKPA